MKQVLLYTISLLCVFLLLGALPLEGEAQIYEDVIRLHILAASDTAEDQALKLAVRDAILEEHSALLRGESTADAAAHVQNALPAIEATARAVLEAHGSTAALQVTFSDEVYPTRTYGPLTFPAGRYHSLLIVIGEGAGQNWWCVLFPPLCVGAASGEVVSPALPEQVPEGVSPAAWRLVSESGDYEIRFRLLEWLATQEEDQSTRFCLSPRK